MQCFFLIIKGGDTGNSDLPKLSVKGKSEMSLNSIHSIHIGAWVKNFQTLPTEYFFQRFVFDQNFHFPRNLGKPSAIIKRRHPV